MDDRTRLRLNRGIGRAAAAILVLGVLAALIVPLWSVDTDLDDQVALTGDLREILQEQLAETERLVSASLPVLEQAEPVLEDAGPVLELLADDLPALRRLIDESLPLVAVLQDETIPRIHRLADEALPLQRRLVELGEASLAAQEEGLEIARATLAEVREINRRMAALEPATTPAEVVE